MDSWAALSCAAHRTILNARGRCAPRGTMSESYLCSARCARGCSWMRVFPHGSMSDSDWHSAQDVRGLGAFQWTNGWFLPV
eukprot:6507906-Pyramimonas_sp.AAC.1